MIRRGSVLVTQPYFPGYRIALFEHVQRLLRESSVEVDFVYGAEGLAVGGRRGDARLPNWARCVPECVMTIKGRSIYFRRDLLERDYDLVLTELAAGNGNAWMSKFSGVPYILLGHGMGYTDLEGPLSKRLEGVLCSSARHVLTYVESGRVEVLRRSTLDESQVTAFGNTVDTSQILSRAQHGPELAEQVRRRLGIPHNAKCAVVLGALESYKNIDLIVSAARRVFERRPDAWLIVAGSGDEIQKIRLLEADSAKVTVLGHMSRDEIPDLVGLSSVLINPGRIGLVAVDAIALRMRVLTCVGARHAPEAEYLIAGRDMFEAADDVESFSEAWLRLLEMPSLPEDNSRVPLLSDAARIISESVLRSLDK